MLQGFDGTCAAVFERVDSPADSRANSICILKDWNEEIAPKSVGFFYCILVWNLPIQKKV